MNRQRLLVFGLVLAAAAIVVLLWLVPWLGRTDALTGYVEGEPLYLAAPVSGALTELAVQRGDRVAAGQRLFVVDPEQLSAERAQAAAAAEAAQAEVADARKGQRPVELAVLDANVAAAQARAQEAEAELRRVSVLAQRGFYAPARLDDAEAAAETARAQLAAARRQRQAAELGAREDQVRAAESRARQARAQVDAAEARLRNLAPPAPADAQVEDVFYQEGEWVAANQPVLSLLPDDRVKIRFFAPQDEIEAYRPGRSVAFACDGCADGLTAEITYVSPRPEFTPPVIYSRDARDRLVFMVEARPSARLRPGQPVDVVPLAPAPERAR